MRLDQLDHLVLTVRDIGETVAFYTRVLGMEEVAFGEHRKALTFGTQKINLHEAGREFEPKALHPRPGSADLCFLTSEPLARVVVHLGNCGVAVLEGPIDRTGAQGPLESIYLRDPDGNLIEIANQLPLPSLSS
ncbi:MAG: VOC family protein [Chthoniobacter sp.]